MVPLIIVVCRRIYMESMIFVSLLWTICRKLGYNTLVWSTLCSMLESLRVVTRIVGLLSHVVVAMLRMILKCSWIVKMRKLGVWLLILDLCPLIWSVL